MLTLSGAPDRVVSRSEFSLSIKRSENYTVQFLSYSFFKLLQDLSF